MPLLKTYGYFMVIFFSFSGNIFAQENETLPWKKLTEKDIDSTGINNSQAILFSGTRSQKLLKNLPFTAFIITEEEIRENGYRNLVDVIKFLPGVKVSQPGSAIYGDAFINRGLLGNAYTKILINGLPIKPSVLHTMPIDHQLPIYQAERIEVIFGPAATLFGSDAVNGVINIVIKDSEYPTYVQSKMEGGFQDQSNIDVFFGGKFAIGKKTMKIKAFGGSNTVSHKRIIYNQEELYDIEKYKSEYDNIDLHPIALSSNFSEISEIQIPLSPSTSNYIGMYASIGKFEFRTHRMYRQEFTNTGINPLAVSYKDAQTQFGEEILSSSVSISNQFAKWNYRAQLSASLFNLNAQSSANFISPGFAIVANQFYQNNTIGLNEEQVTTKLDSLYFSNSRYFQNRSSDIVIDIQVNAQLSPKFELISGIQTNGGDGVPLTSFNAAPRNREDRTIETPRIERLDALFGDASIYSELFFSSRKWNLIAGVQLFFREDEITETELEFNPRLGFNYSVNDRLNIRASISNAFNHPNAYLSASSYTLADVNDLQNIIPGSSEISAESIANFELGMRYVIPNKLQFDLGVHFLRLSNLVDFNIRQNQDGTVFWGYENQSEAYTNSLGTYIDLNHKFPESNFLNFLRFNLNFALGRERTKSLEYIDNYEKEYIDLKEIRNQPQWISNLIFSISPLSRIKLNFYNTFNSSALTNNKLWIQNRLSNNSNEQIRIPSFYKLDLRVNFIISRQLSMHMDFINLSNTKYGGIDGIDNLDILYYNPQSLFTSRVGINYTFN